MILVHFENGAKCDGSKILVSVHVILEQFENGRELEDDKLVAISSRIFSTCVHNLKMCDLAKVLQIFTKDDTIGSMIGMAT